MPVLTAPSVYYLPRDQIGLVQRGERTLLLLPLDPDAGETELPHRPSARIGLAAPGSRSAMVHVFITRQWTAALDELDDDDAHDLGLRDRYALADYWRETIAGAGEFATARAWLIRFKLDPSELPRLLAKGRGYTQSPAFALPGAGEAVNDFALRGSTELAAAAEQKRYDQERARRKQLPADERLHLVMTDATVRGHNDPKIDRPLHVITQKLEELEALVLRPGRSAIADD